MLESQQNISSNLVESGGAPFQVNNFQSRFSGSVPNPKQIPPMVTSSSPGIIVSQGMGYPSYNSPSIIANNTSGFMKPDSYVVNTVPSGLEAFRQECLRKIEQASREKNMEIKIIRQSLRRTQQEQIDDINKSYKFEIEATKQEHNSEAEAGITTEIVQLQKAKELRLLQQEEFARKDSEIEGEKIRRRVEEALRDEQQKFSQMHQLQLQNIK